DARAEREDLGHGQACAAQAGAEVFSLEPLDGEGGLSLGRIPVRDEADDGWGRDAGEDLCFSVEALGLQRAMLVEDLERDRAPGEAVVRAVDLAHAPRAGEALDLEAIGDGAPGLHGGRVSSGEVRRSTLSMIAPRGVAAASIRADTRRRAQ